MRGGGTDAREVWRGWLRVAAETAALAVAMPQVFLFLYYARDLAVGSGARAPFARALALYGLAVAQVSAPYVIALTLALRVLIRRRVRVGVTLGCAVAAGYLWVAVWNGLILESFSYGGATVPILLCSLVFAGYAAARRLYLDSLEPLLPPRPAAPAAGENEAAGLSG